MPSMLTSPRARRSEIAQKDQTGAVSDIETHPALERGLRVARGSARSGDVQRRPKQFFRARRLLIGLVAACGWTKPADAAPLVVVQGSSPCPTPAELRPTIEEWRLRVPTLSTETWVAQLDQPHAGSARLRLVNSEGQLRLERTIESQDCEALAKAFLIILEAHFLDLGLVASSDDRPATEKPQRPRPAKKAARHVPLQSEVLWRLGVGLGPQWAMPDPGVTGAVQLLVAPVFSRTWAIQLSLTAGLSQLQSEGRARDRVESQGFDAALAVAKRLQLSSTTWLEPRLGGGVRRTWARARDIPADPAVSFRPVTHSAVAAGVQVARNWSLRLDVVGQLVLNRDNYAIEPYGTVGRGPRSLFLSTFGAEYLAW